MWRCVGVVVTRTIDAIGTEVSVLTVTGTSSEVAVQVARVATTRYR